jgi:membrane protein/epoxyqueuosine reductase
MWNPKLASQLAESGRDGLARSRVANLLLPSLRYLFATEVHAYAFSIAANAYLSFFPFTLILLAICRRWLHWEGAYQVVLQTLRIHLPAGAESVIRNLSVLAQGRPRLQLMSFFMLFFTSSGVFLPLEIALNKVWCFDRNRSFLKNQAVSLVLAFVSGGLALSYIFAATGLQWMITSALGWIPSRGLVSTISQFALEIASIPLAVSIFFLIYYVLPNGPVPVIHVLPAALVAGVVTEVGKFLYTFTLPLFRFREVYGPFALSVTLLFWAYIGALILLFGAHLSARTFTQREFPRAAAAANPPQVPYSRGGI